LAGKPKKFALASVAQEDRQQPPLPHACNLDAVFQLRLAGRARAVDAAEDLSVRFDAVSDYPAVAMGANRRQRVDRALEAIEGVMFAANDYFKRLVIFILANLACSHIQIFRAPWALRRCSLDFYQQKPPSLDSVFPSGSARRLQQKVEMHEESDSLPRRRYGNTKTTDRLFE
jgi:hypothetical protein